MQKNVIAIIPARGGSIGIPRKNLRPIAGKPLIYFTIQACLKSKKLNRVVVSTDDDEIALFAQRFGAEVLMRSKELADDITTLDPVILSAVKQAENEYNEIYDITVTVQPTSPLIVAADIDTAIDSLGDNVDTVLSVVEDRHLCWGIVNGHAQPSYQDRVNRQQLPVNFKETGAVIACTRQQLETGSRIGKAVRLLEIPHDRSFDIDTFADLALCESLLKRKRIVFTVIGYNEVGLGHAFRALMLAHELVQYDLHFICEQKSHVAKKLIKKQNYIVHTCNDGELVSACNELSPDLIINDILDTSSKFIDQLKNIGAKILNFEDLGEGSKKADLVINALYPQQESTSNVLVGSKYFCLRDEFIYINKIDHKKEVDTVLLTFGGIDEGDLTKRCLEIIANYCQENKIIIDVVTGPGYPHQIDVDYFMHKYNGLKIKYSKGSRRISNHMNRADLAITSGGQTVYELVSLQVPTIVICQNERETTHEFASADNGIINLGYRGDVENSAILTNFKSVVEDMITRDRMIDLARKEDLVSGKNRVIKKIKELIEE
jgi:CMP-N-acetylneuraminic acid synthetase/spore coat polysaccharide biosynthesis predicted glycosyltransferase SpsG